ncbi:MAG: tetratricopeptide repeat protein [candidate division WOR-3 bacterium]
MKQTGPAGKQKAVPVPMQRGRVVWPFLAVAGVGLVVRVCYLLQARQTDPLFFSPQLDALYHHQWAMAIASGMEFIHDAYFRAPLYPTFLALLYKLFGVNLLAARLVQAVIGGASCGLLYLVSKRLFDSRTGSAAGLIMGVYPLFIYFDGELLISVMLVFLLLLGMLLLLRSRERDRHWWLPGFVFGLAAIARPNVLAFLVVVPLWLILEFRRDWWQKPLIFSLAALVPILPVTIRNYLVSRQLVVIAWQGGTNFYIGNNEYSDGTTAIVPGTRGTWWGGYNDVKTGAERALGRRLKGAEIDRFWFGRGFEFWRRMPGRALLLTLKKLYLWFAGYEVSNDRDLYFFKRYTFLNLLLFKTGWLKFPFGVVLPLALVGILQTQRRWRQLLPVYLFIGAWTLSFIPFFVTARYRMPVVPFFILLAVEGVRQLEARRLVPVLAIGLGSFLLFNLNLAGTGRMADPGQNHLTAAMGWHSQGRIAEAAAELSRALELDSATNILSLQATLLVEQGRVAEARGIGAAAVRLHPEDPDAWGISGNVLAAAGELDSAWCCFQRVIELDPYSVEGWNNLGNIALTRGELGRARGFYEQALLINPSFPTALFHLGLVNYYEGKRDSAHILWQKVLRLDPNNELVRQALQELR